MGIMRMISNALAMIKLIKEDLVFHPSENAELVAFVTDTERFFLRHGSILESAPLQVYSSALLFSPKESIVRNHFYGSVLAWIQNSPEVEEKWGSCLVSMGGQSRMNCMVFSPDQEILATGSLDNNVLLWDVGTGLLLHTLEGHLESVLVLAFSPKAPYVASGSKDKTVRIWESVTGHLRTLLEGHAAPIMIIVFSSDGKMLVTASADRTLGVWDVETGRRCCKFEGRSMPINAISMTPDGRLVASGSDDCTVRLWDIESRQLWATLRAHANAVKSVAFSPDGHILASGSHDKNVRLWHLKTRAAFSLLEGHTEIVTCVVISSDGKIVASAGDDDKVGLWNVQSGEHIACLEVRGERSYIKGLEFCDSSRLLVIFHGDSTIRIWNVARRTLMKTLKSYPSSLRCFAISSSGRLAATGANFRTAQLWNAHLGDSQLTIEGHQEPPLHISSPRMDDLRSHATRKMHCVFGMYTQENVFGFYTAGLRTPKSPERRNLHSLLTALV